MNEKKVSAYRRIVSSTAVFGSAQVLNVLVNIIRGKLVAYILHSTGMGLSTIFSQAANTIQQFSLMGLNIAAVPSISQADSDKNEMILAYTIRIVRRIVLIASLLGFVTTLAISPILSKSSFDDLNHTPYFLLLGIAVFFNVMGMGETAVMQGLRKYKLLAICSIIPPLCGLLLSIPIYLIWGTEGIIPAMIVGSIVYFCAIRFLSYRPKKDIGKPEKVTLKDMWKHGRGIIQTGAIITFGSLLGTITTYALTSYISNTGSVEDAGFYHASNIIVGQYTGLIFSAMAADYYPNLSSLLKTNVHQAFKLVNQQIEIIMLIMTPLTMLLIMTAPLAIQILLTDEFLCIEQMVCYVGLASVFKAFCFPMDYIAFAKTDKKYIFWVETVWGSGKTLIIMGTFYHFLGLNGLGYGALCVSIIDVGISTTLIPWRYKLHFSKKTITLVIFTLTLACCCLIGSLLPFAFEKYLIMSVTTLIAIVFSIRELNKRIDFRKLLHKVKS